MIPKPNDGDVKPTFLPRLALLELRIRQHSSSFHIPAPHSHVTMDLSAPHVFSNSYVPAQNVSWCQLTGTRGIR